jgi:hypothetical protein
MYATYTTNCGGIQLIWSVESFYTDHFQTVVHDEMVHRKRALTRLCIGQYSMQGAPVFMAIGDIWVLCIC